MNHRRDEPLSEPNDLPQSLRPHFKQVEEEKARMLNEIGIQNLNL